MLVLLKAATNRCAQMQSHVGRAQHKMSQRAMSRNHNPPPLSAPACPPPLQALCSGPGGPAGALRGGRHQLPGATVSTCQWIFAGAAAAQQCCSSVGNSSPGGSPDCPLLWRQPRLIQAPSCRHDMASNSSLYPEAEAQLAQISAAVLQAPPNVTVPVDAAASAAEGATWTLPATNPPQVRHRYRRGGCAAWRWAAPTCTCTAGRRQHLPPPPPLPPYPTQATPPCPGFPGAGPVRGLQHGGRLPKDQRIWHQERGG